MLNSNSSSSCTPPTHPHPHPLALKLLSWEDSHRHRAGQAEDNLADCSLPHSPQAVEDWDSLYGVEPTVTSLVDMYKRTAPDLEWMQCTNISALRFKEKASGCCCYFFADLTVNALTMWNARAKSGIGTWEWFFFFPFFFSRWMNVFGNEGTVRIKKT